MKKALKTKILMWHSLEKTKARTHQKGRQNLYLDILALNGIDYIEVKEN